MNNTTAPEGFKKNPAGEFWDGPEVSAGRVTLSTSWDADTKTTVIVRQNRTEFDYLTVEDLRELHSAIGVLMLRLGSSHLAPVATIQLHRAEKS